MRRYCLSLVIILLCTPALYAQNIVSNGDFEYPIIGVNDSYCFFAGAQLNGWTVESDSVDLVHGLWQAASGSQSIDLSGNKPGGIFQNLATIQNQLYTLSFAMAGNIAYTSIKTMEVWWGTTKLDTLTFNTTGYSRTNMGWRYHNYTVTGSGNDKLRFVSLGGPGAYGPALDNVSVIMAVPEPSGFLALMAGLGGFVGVVRRRKTSQRSGVRPG